MHAVSRGFSLLILNRYLCVNVRPFRVLSRRVGSILRAMLSDCLCVCVCVRARGLDSPGSDAVSIVGRLVQRERHPWTDVQHRQDRTHPDAINRYAARIASRLLPVGLLNRPVYTTGFGLGRGDTADDQPFAAERSTMTSFSPKYVQVLNEFYQKLLTSEDLVYLPDSQILYWGCGLDLTGDCRPQVGTK